MQPHKLNDGKWTISIPMLDGSTQFSCYCFSTEHAASCFISSGGASIIRDMHKGAA